MGNSEQAFVTGAAGQLGSALAERLMRDGYEITALIKEHHDDSFLRKIGVRRIIRGDLKKPETFSDAVPEGCIIFHCYSLSPGANAAQEVYNQENVFASQNILRVAKEKNARQFIYASSVSVVGPKATASHWITENDPPHPNEPYGKSKHAVEKELMRFHDETDIPTLILRIFPMYGPRAHRNSTPVRLCKLLSKKRFFIVGDGSNVYEFCYSKNAADGIALAAQKIRSGLEIFNISEPVKRTYLEIINELAQRVNPKVKIVRVPKLAALAIGCAGELAYKVTHKRTITRLRTVQGLLGGWTADCSKEVRVLGYTQRYTLEQGVEEFVQWVKESGILEKEGVKL